jgi:hypothetical protein
MGRLAIIEEDGNTSEAKQTTQPPANEAAAHQPAINPSSEASVNTASRVKQGGVSDESGYYEGDDLPLQGDDSIEIVYDRLAKNDNSGRTAASVSVTPISCPTVTLSSSSSASNNVPQDSSARMQGFISQTNGRRPFFFL